MRILPILAWRNIWRHPARSGVLLAAVAIGLWAGVLVIAWANGWLRQRMDYLIEREVGHAQIHAPEFLADIRPGHTIPGHEAVTAWLDHRPEVRAHTSRTLIEGMLQSPVKTSGVRIRGLHPETETRTTRFHENMVEGEYLDSELRHAAIVSRILADEHNLRIGNRLVLTFENLDGELTSAAFLISGLFASASSEYDKRNVFVRANDLMPLLADEPVHHEIGIMLHDEAKADELTEALHEHFEGIRAQTWRSLSPELSLIVELGDVMVFIITLIIMIALGFGILNTMLMALFERMREIGMLLSIGMSRCRVFVMILFEATLLTLSGAGIGLLLAVISIRRLEVTGINLEMFAEGAALIGFDFLIYPFLSVRDYAVVSAIVIMVTFLASLYPALKATRINPLEAAQDH